MEKTILGNKNIKQAITKEKLIKYAVLQLEMISKTRKLFLLTKTKCPKKVHCNIIYSRKRFLKIKTCSAERRSQS